MSLPNVAEHGLLVANKQVRRGHKIVVDEWVGRTTPNYSLPTTKGWTNGSTNDGEIDQQTEKASH